MDFIGNGSSASAKRSDPYLAHKSICLENTYFSELIELCPQ